MATVAVNIRTEKYDVYCGRGKGGKIPTTIGEYGWLGNPIPVGGVCPECGQVHPDNASVLPCYSKYLWRKMQSVIWCHAFFNTCWNKRLGCFCKPEPCHCDVIIRALKWLHDTKGWG